MVFIQVHVPVTKMEPIKKPTPLDKNTITGLIVIAVVCCVVGTSLVWVVIIYQMRRRQNRNSSTETGEATVPLNGGSKTCTSTQKIGDSISNSSNSSSSSQTKTDSFFGKYSCIFSSLLDFASFPPILWPWE